MNFILQLSNVARWDRQKTVYFGCRGKIFKYISGQYTSAVSTHQKCVPPFIASGAVIALAAAKTTRLGIKTHSFD